MIPKYTIEYSDRHDRVPVNHYGTDDSVACEEFITELLERGVRIRAIKHEGLNLPNPDFDKMIKTSAGMLASKRICAALGIKPDEERFRFGFARIEKQSLSAIN